MKSSGVFLALRSAFNPSRILRTFLSSFRRKKPVSVKSLAVAFGSLEAKAEVQARNADAEKSVNETSQLETPELGRLAKLPAFRPVIISLLRLFDRDDIGVADIINLVQSDPALVSELLGLVNSPLFAIRGNVSTPEHAITLLGMEHTRSLVTTLAMRAMLNNAPRTPVVRRLWVHSVATAAIARELAPVFGSPGDIAYIAGIMHDLGRMGLLAAYSDEYSGLALTAHDNVEAIMAAERAACGLDHCQAGLLLARAWNFPAIFHGAISHHHETPNGGGIVTLVQLCCRLADDFMFQAIPHRNTHKPIETIRLCAPAELVQILSQKVDAARERVLETVQQLDF